MKIAFAVSVFFEFGGVQRDLLRIAKECRRRGHEVHVFTGQWDAPREPGIHIHELDTWALSNHARNARLGRQVQAAVKAAGDFDCVVGFTKLPGLDIYYGGDPCFAARLADEKPGFYRWLPRYRAFLAQETAVFKAGGDTEILLIAHDEAERFKGYYGTEPARLHLLPPGLNRERLFKDVPDEAGRRALRSEFYLGNDDFLILNIGSRFRTKGVDRMLLALQALPAELQARSALVVVGGDRAAPYLKLAKRLGIADRVFFPGARDDVARFYYAADLLLHPAYTENTGTTLLEAIACGLPVLATENCGYAFHVRKAGAGLICPLPFNQPVLNRLLVEGLTSGERAVWRANGPAYCAKADLYRLIERAADIILERAASNRRKKISY